MVFKILKQQQLCLNWPDTVETCLNVLNSHNFTHIFFNFINHNLWFIKLKKILVKLCLWFINASPYPRWGEFVKKEVWLTQRGNCLPEFKSRRRRSQKYCTQEKFKCLPNSKILLTLAEEKGKKYTSYGNGKSNLIFKI